MQIKHSSYEGWPHNVVLANEHVELIVTLDAGPRIISYRTLKGRNVFHNYPEQIGGTGETQWMIRGGHRLWVAPEGEVSYALDNTAVSHEVLADGIRVENSSCAPWGIRKTMTVTLAEESSEAVVRHLLTNESAQPVEMSSWAMSVMAPGGLEVLPLPELGEHPRDLLPNRLLVPWPYTDMTDPRWRFGWQFITLRQTEDGLPTKLGLAHKEKWVAYLNGESLFVKTFDYEAGAVYPDFGCNFETFTNEEMLEIESLSPLRRLQPGESVGHTERWFLAGEVTQPPSLQEEDLAQWIKPVLERLAIQGV